MSLFPFLSLSLYLSILPFSIISFELSHLSFKNSILIPTPYGYFATRDFFLSVSLLYFDGPIPASFIIYFRSFQTNIIIIFTTIQCEKCPSSIRCWDSNPWPLDHESPPITTRPGLPPKSLYFLHLLFYASLKVFIILHIYF